jgi:hypothetical protein
MSEANNPPVYSPASSDSIHESEAQSLAITTSSTDSSVLTDNQTFTAISRDSSVMSESAAVNNVILSALDSILGVDAVKSRTFNSIENITLVDSGAPNVKLVVTEHVQGADNPSLFVPISQADRSQGTDGSRSVATHLTATDSVRGVDSGTFVYKPVAKELIHATENTSIVENPPNFNASITVTDSVNATDVAKSTLVIINTQNSVMSETQSPFARSVATDRVATLQPERQTVVIHVSTSDSAKMSESASVVRSSNAMDFVNGRDNQNGGPVSADLSIMTETASVVEYLALDFNVWAYGQVSVLQ